MSLASRREPKPVPVEPGIELPSDSIGYRVKNRLLGPPLHTAELEHERLGKPTALAVFASDNLSSSAYATEEILRVLVPVVGIAAFSLVVPITIAMLVVLGLLILSYRQTIKAYPSAGGAYMVTRDNFGILPAQVAGVSLLTDYILTVAVSVAAGTAALASAFAGLRPYVVPIAIFFVLLIAFGNLRGVRESGKVFAVPTYFFMANMVVLLGYGLFQMFWGDLPRAQNDVKGMMEFGDAGAGLLMGASLFKVLHAFASGGAAVTGVEAISNGVPAFRKPEWKNASTTLVVMGSLLGVMFLGLSTLAGKLHIAPFEHGVPTVLSQIGELIYGTSALGNALYLSLTAGTMLILVLAANTAFADFPRLTSFVAGDNFMPRQLMKRGHRLVFSNGIVFLSAAAIVLLVVTRAKVDRLIPLYAVGVFTSFTLSQAGMTKHHVTKKEPGWQRGIVINATGAAISFVVAVIIATTKFTHGAWVIIVLVPIMVAFLVRLEKQYGREAYQLEHDVPEAITVPIKRRLSVLVFIDRLDLAAARAMQFGRTLRSDELRAVHFVIDQVKADELAASWRQYGFADLGLELVDCPDRRLTRAAVSAVARALADGETEVCVLLPDRMYGGAWHRVLHDQTAAALAREISRLPHANVTTVPFHLGGTVQGEPELLVEPEPKSELAHEHGEGQAGLRSVIPAPLEAAARGDDHGDVAMVRADHVGDISALRWRQWARVGGRVHAVRVKSLSGSPTVEYLLTDDTASVSILFFGRREIAGINMGTEMTVEGRVIEHHGRLAIVNPLFELRVSAPDSA